MTEAEYERFMNKVKLRAHDCWNWQAACNKGGYGVFHVGQPSSARVAHRVLYEHLHGAVPKGFELDHLCGNKACVNPDHLEVVTHRENWLREGAPHGKFFCVRRCKYGHWLTDDNVRIFNDRKRRCLQCWKEKCAAKKQARHEGKR
jgi:hypothetical protein